MWNQNVPEGRNSKSKVPKADMNLIRSGTERSVCAGGEGPSRGGCQEADEEDRLYGAQGGFKQRQHDAMCVVSKLILAAGRGKNWRG